MNSNIPNIDLANIKSRLETTNVYLIDTSRDPNRLLGYIFVFTYIRKGLFYIT